MIDTRSFELYNKIAKDNYDYMWDLSIIYQVEETINMQELDLSAEDFRRLCSEVKRQSLKYNDISLDDELVQEVLNEMGLFNE